MSSVRRRLGVATTAAVGVSGVLAAVALATSGPMTAQAATAPYFTPPPSPTASPLPVPSPLPSAQPVDPQKVLEVVQSLTTGLTGAAAQTVTQALTTATAALSGSGLSTAQQSAALDTVVTLTVGITDAGQKAAVITTTAAAAGEIAKLPASDAAAAATIISGLSAGTKSAAANLTDPGAQAAVSATLSQVVSTLSSSKTLSVLTSDVVAKLIETTAKAVKEHKGDGDTKGIVMTPTVDPSGNIRMSYSGLKPGSTFVLVFNITDGKVSAALRRAYGSRISAALDAAGRGTLVLTGTVDETGHVVLNAPGSAFGATNAAQGLAALGKTVVSVIGTSSSGASAVFASAASGSRPTTPTVVVRTPEVTANHPAVLGGTAQPGTTVQLLARTASGSYQVVRSTVVGSSGHYSFSVSPTANTRFVVRSILRGAVTDSPSTVVNVRARVTETVTHLSGRTFRFAGTVSPAKAGSVVNVFFGNERGAWLVTQAVTAADGSWSVVRTFLGAGTFNAFSRSAGTAHNVVGTSPVTVFAIA